MLIVRLKQCEHALADGCLERAFELARSAGFRSHRRGQQLARQLVEAYTRRAQEHAAAGRTADAAADCDRAASLAGNTAEVAQLRSVLAEATADRLESERIRAQQLSAARRGMDAGQLTVVQNLLTPMQDEPRFDALQRDLATRRALLQSALAKASACFGGGDWQAAIDHLEGMCQRFPADGELHLLAARIERHVSGLINSAIESGRLDSALILLARLDRLGRASVETDQLRRSLQDFSRAFDQIRDADGSRAKETLHRLASQWPDAAWLKSATGQLRQFTEALQELRSGPLGLLAQLDVPADPHETIAMPHQRRGAHPPATPAPRKPVILSHDQFLLHVDGIGSFLVTDKSSVVIGPVSSTESPDVALLAGSDVASVTISRNDGDYVLQSRQPVQVNEKTTSGRLLSGGEKIALGPRCRFAFRRPSAASGTAVLDLTGARLGRGDVRQIILLDREILIGPGAASHVRCDSLPQAAVLQFGGRGKLFLRCAEAVQIDGSPASGKPVEIVPGAHVTAGPVSFVITKE